MRPMPDTARARDLRGDVRRLKEGLGALPEPAATPSLIVISGLPGTGKSHFARKLRERFPSAILESDALRKGLFPAPGYGPEESAYLFKVCHLLIEELLRKRIPLIFDATNLSERHRERLYELAAASGARLILVRVEAPPPLVHERLEARHEVPERQDSSDADWGVYLKMKGEVERMRRRHFAVDTSRDISPVIDKIVREVGR